MHTEEKLPYQVYRNTVYEEDRRLFAAKKVRCPQQAVFSPTKGLVEKTRNITLLYDALDRLERSPTLAQKQNNTEKKMNANLMVVTANQVFRDPPQDRSALRSPAKETARSPSKSYTEKFAKFHPASSTCLPSCPERPPIRRPNHPQDFTHSPAKGDRLQAMIEDEQFLRDFKKYEHALIEKIAKERGISEESLERRKEIRSQLRKKRRERLRKVNEEIQRLEREALQDTPYDPIRSYLADGIGRLVTSPVREDFQDESSEPEVERYVPSKKPKKPLGSPTTASTGSKILTATDFTKTSPGKPSKPMRDGGRAGKEPANRPRRPQSGSSREEDRLRHALDSLTTPEKKKKGGELPEASGKDRQDETQRKKQKEAEGFVAKTFDERKWRNDDGLEEVSKVFNNTQLSDLTRQQGSFDEDSNVELTREKKFPDGNRSIDDNLLSQLDDKPSDRLADKDSSNFGHLADKKNIPKKSIEYYDMKPIEFSPDNKYKLVFQTVRLSSRRGSSESKKSIDQTISNKKGRIAKKQVSEETEIDRLIDQLTERLDPRAPKANQTATNQTGSQGKQSSENKKPDSKAKIDLPEMPAISKQPPNTRKETTPKKQERENIKPITPTKPSNNKSTLNPLASNFNFFEEEGKHKNKKKPRDASADSRETGKSANVQLSPTDRKPSPSRSEIMELILKYYK